MNKTSSTPGEISATRRAWCGGTAFEAIFYSAPEKEDSSRKEGGNDNTLILRKSGERMAAVKIQLTQMTEAELVALHRVIEIAFANSLEIVRGRDEAAMQMLEDGETGLSRMFRPDPRVIVRESDDYSVEPKILKREWEGGDGTQYEFNPAYITRETFISSRNPDED